MDYVIELLQRELIQETECRTDAIEYLNPTGTKVTSLECAKHSTRSAFIESLKIAEARIPQLVNAIELLKLNR